MSVDALGLDGGAWARAMIEHGRARALSLISVRGP